MALPKIWIFSPEAFQEYGHSFDYVAGLGGALADEGADVHVVGWDGPNRFEPGITDHQIRGPLSQLEYRTAYRERYGRLGDVVWGVHRIRRDRAMLRRFWELVEGAEGPNAILFESFEYAILGLDWTLPRRAAWAGAIFHDTSFDGKGKSRIASLYKRAMRWPARRVVGMVDDVFVHGPGMRTNLVETLGIPPGTRSRIHVIPYGAPHPDEIDQPAAAATARKELGLPETVPLGLSFGTARDDKRYDVVLRALVDAPEWHVLFAGPEGDVTHDAIRDMAERLGVLDRVRFVNRFIPRSEQPVYFAAADVVLVVYDSSVRHESGTAKLARTFDRPILAAGAPDLVDYTEATGCGWTSALDGEAMAEVLRSAASLSAEEEAALHRRIRATAVENSWAGVASTLIDRIAAASNEDGR